jgi:hypothetical protein
MKYCALNNHGVTLVEIMVAALLVAISVFSLSIMMPQGRAIINETRHRIVVLDKAQQQMERLKYVQKVNGGDLPLNENRSFSDTLVLHTDGDPPTTTVPLDAQVMMVPSQRTNNAGLPVYYNVSVIYNWRDPSTGRNCEISLSGFF